MYCCANCSSLLSRYIPKQQEEEEVEDERVLGRRTCVICCGILEEQLGGNNQKNLFYDESLMQEILGTYGLRPAAADTNTDASQEHIHVDAPSVSLPGEVIARAAAVISLCHNNNDSSSSNKSSSLAEIIQDQYINQAKQIVKGYLRTYLEENYNIKFSSRNGSLNLHVAFSIDGGENFVLYEILNISHNNAAANSKKRKRRSLPKNTIRTGGNPIEHLDVRIEASLNKEKPGIQLINSSKVLRALPIKLNDKNTQRIKEWFKTTEKYEISAKYWCTVWRTAFYLQGRYTKSRRDVPQTPFFVTESNGKSVRKGVSSVEDEISSAISTGCSGISGLNDLDDIKFGVCKMHASGREDMDVRMIAKYSHKGGRPFVCEVIDAVKYPCELKLREIVENLNKASKGEMNFWSNVDGYYGKNDGGVGIDGLTFTDAQTFSNLQASTENKVKHYGCRCWSAKKLNQDMIQNLLTRDTPLEIIQSTPVRVLHRRAALERNRTVLMMKAIQVDDHYFHLHLSTSAGTYVKEFVHGDLGRTTPSVSSILNCKVDILELDCEGIECGE